MIKDFKPRLYQETILATTVNYNTLVVLPTGMGKTALAMMLASQRMKQYPNSKILMLAPTRPLVEQHMQTFKKHIVAEEDKFVLFTGMVKPEKRAELWKTAQMIFSTPQGLENDVINSKIDLNDVSLIVFDEAHKAVKDYSYVWLAKQYYQKSNRPRILGLTASPGSDLETIRDICKNLFVEEIEVRTDKDPDMKPYIQDVKIEWVEVDLPDSMREIKNFLENCFKSKLKEMKGYGYVNSIQTQFMGKKDLLMLQARLHGELANGNKDFNAMKSISLVAEALKVQHALELVETQGVEPLYNYMSKLQSQSVTTKVKAVQNLVRDLNFRSAYVKVNTLIEKNTEHPKLSKLKQMLADEVDEDFKTIIFTQYRDSAQKISDEINKIQGINSKVFVGQTKKGETGLTQKKQIEMLNEFREGKFNTICMTSVGEEGLDIPSVNMVMFYEPVPSAIRTIQRRGRTGRLEKGRVVMLVTKGTRDVGYKWSAHHKEKKMYKTLATIKKDFKLKTGVKNASLANYVSKEEDKPTIFVDYREKNNNIVKELIELGVNTKLEKLNVGDYLCSGRVGVEMKEVSDFVNSIIDGRLLDQVKEIKRNFERPIFIVEGTQDIYSVRNIHPNAIRGMLATIAVSYGVPIIYTKDFKESAHLLYTISKREQAGDKSDFSMHGERKPMNVREQQEYIVSALPGVGPLLAKELLKKFKTVKKVINADPKELKEVEKIGDKKAHGIKEIVDVEYKF